MFEEAALLIRMHVVTCHALFSLFKSSIWDQQTAHTDAQLAKTFLVWDCFVFAKLYVVQLRTYKAHGIISSRS